MNSTHVRRHGEGAPAVLTIHGLGVDHTLLRRTHERLGLPGTFLYFDLVGCGRAPEPAAWADVTHATFVEQVEQVRAAENLETMVLYGHSYGCAIALEYALAHPQRVRALILCDGGPAMDHLAHSLDIARARSRNGEYEALMRRLAAPPATADDLAAFWQECAPLYVQTAPAAELLAMMSECTYRPAAYNHVIGTLAPQYDVRDRLHQIPCPTLLLSGRHDWIHPLEHQAAVLHERMPDTELVVFEESGTLPFLEEPERYAQAVSEWLNRRVTPAPRMTG